MFNTIFVKPMGYILKWFCSIFGGSFPLAIFFFTLAINLVFLPLNIKQQKGNASQARMKNKMAKIKEKYYESDRNRYNDEMNKLYQESGTSTMMGCLLLFIRMPFFIAIYNVFRSPFTLMLGVNSALVESAKAAFANIMNIADASTVTEHQLLNGLSKLTGAEFAPLHSAADGVSFTFFGINLTETPSFADGVSILWIIPLLSFVTSLLSAFVSSIMQKINNPGAPNPMGMMLMMPVFSLIIAFTVPGAVGLYWAFSNFIGMVVMTAMQYLFAPSRTIANLEAKEIRARRKVEEARMASFKQ